MRLIYACAKIVNTWLGPATPDRAIDIEIFSYLATGKDVANKPLWETLPPYLAKAGLSDIMT
jgi:hypothetical protein